MPKLTLDLDALTVSTFATQEDVRAGLDAVAGTGASLSCYCTLLTQHTSDRA
ncbi:MAG: hypothetical protein JWM27_4813 [Gemmatimonadetes bacterium]|nr:hypothetical protein [Gemmatimonadota bacterium]